MFSILFFYNFQHQKAAGSEKRESVEISGKNHTVCFSGSSSRAFAWEQTSH